jgi:mitotic-spindle organizing protein 1
MSSVPSDPRAATATTVDVVTEIAGLLNTGLDRKAVQITMALVDAGVNPAALAAAILELRKQARELGLEKH